MEEQIQKAVEIALSGTAEVGLKNEAIAFINHIRSTEEGYQSSLAILVDSAQNLRPLNEGLKFFVFQVIDEDIAKLTEEQLFDLNTKLFQYFEYLIQSHPNEPSYLKNKFAGIMGRLFCYTYLSVNPTFMKNLLSCIADNKAIAVDMYARILMAIHTEIGDRFIPRSKEEQDRNIFLKDTIRNEDMSLLCSSWKNLLAAPEALDHNTDILNNILKVIGYYVNWMEISLFVNNDFIDVILQYLYKEGQRNETCSTLIEIISKKMRPLNKLELITVLNLPSVIDSIKSNANDEDVDFVESIAKLANQVGIELCIVLELSDVTLVEPVSKNLMVLWPLILMFLSHEYDDVSQQVLPFIQHFLLLCKKYEQLISLELFSELLNKIILKMKYDEDDDGIDDYLSEQFHEIRGKLKLLQDSIALLQPSLFVEAVSIIVNESLFLNDEDNKKDWRTVELGLFELNIMGESLKANVPNIPKQQIHFSKPYLLFQEFLVKLINSDLLLKMGHSKVTLAYVEIIVRHFSTVPDTLKESQLIPRVLDLFVSPFCLLSVDEKVKLRTRYLFFRFVKISKPQLSDPSFTENLFIKIQPQLTVKAELSTKDDDDVVVENDAFSSQLYLFESVGLLVSLLTDNIPQKVEMIDLFFQPLFHDLEKCINNQVENEQLIALQVHHLFEALGTFARGYDHDSNNAYSPDVVAIIENASHVILITLEHLPKFEIVRESARFAFARFIPILNEKASVHLSKLVSITIAASGLGILELSDFLNFLGQIVHRFKRSGSIFQLLNDLLSPLMDKLFGLLKFSGVNEEYESMPDIQRDKSSLKKSFLNFIGAIVSNHLSSLLITETNKHKLPLILESIFQYAYDLKDTVVSKLAVTQLINIVNVMGSNGDKINDPEDQFGENLPPIQGVDEYLMRKGVQLSFELPFQRQEFDLEDAQYRVICQELALLIKTYQEKKGDEFLAFLSSYLTNMGLPPDLMNDFGSNLLKSDQKDFKKYFVSFVLGLKGK